MAEVFGSLAVDQEACKSDWRFHQVSNGHGWLTDSHLAIHESSHPSHGTLSEPRHLGWTETNQCMLLQCQDLSTTMVIQ